MNKRKAIENKIGEYEDELDEIVNNCIESGISIEDIIERLEEYLADMEEIWDEEDLDYVIDDEGFYSLK